jgi:hypothetical protein
MHALEPMRCRRWISAQPLALVLAACGSGPSEKNDGGVHADAGPDHDAAVVDGGGSGRTTTTFDLHVGWPGGTPPAGLTVGTSVGRAPVEGATSAATVIEQGPQLAVALDEAGRPVLLGFVSPTRAALDARSTAEVLLYFGAGVSFRPAALRPAALEAIRTSTLADALAVHVKDALLHDPGALSSRTSTVMLRRDALLRGLFAPSLDVEKAKIEPSEARSGLTILQPGFQTIEIMNEYRRRATAYLTREWYVPEGGGARVSSKAELATVPIAPIKAATSVVGSFVDAAILGDYAWAPVTTDPLSVPLYPSDAEATGYQLLIVGPGATPGPAYADLTPAQVRDLQLVVGQTVVMDFILPILADVCIPIAGQSVDDFVGLSNANVLVQDTLNLITRSAPGALVKAYEGDLVGGVGDVLLTLGTSASFRLGLAQLAFDTLVKRTVSVTQDSYLELVEALAKCVTIVEVGLTVGDLATQATHIGLSDIAERFEVVVTASKIDLDPPKLDLLVGERGWFNVLLRDASLSEAERIRILYTWSTSSDAITLDPPGNNAEVRGRRVGTAVVSVVATLDGIPLGSAEAEVKVLDQNVLIVPRKSSVHPRDSVALTAKLVETSTAHEYRYLWSTQGKHGLFRRGLTVLETREPRVEYLSNTDQEGVEHIQVQALLLDPDGTRTSLGVGRADVFIELRKTVVFGHFFVEVTIGDGFHGAHAYAIIPKVPEATYYEVYGYNFNDWAYYGRSFQVSTSPHAIPPNWEDRGDEYWIGLSSGGGTCTPPCGPPTELIDWLRRRFAGLVVECTVTYP